MYRFVKSSAQSSGSSSSRLFVQGTREGGDRDDVVATGGPGGTVVAHRDHHQLMEVGHANGGPPGAPTDLHAVHTQRRLSTETHGTVTEESCVRRKPSGTRQVITRMVRKTTTLHRGEEKSVANALLNSNKERASLTVQEVVLQSPPKRAKRQEEGYQLWGGRVEPLVH
ncbi:hypothetical protein ONE63_004576 [Megalurothrips usitatus]|uniref:Uncharacterized protein n=1 Tax=Megalurothrips usitatus TaxID=439358 RepID=A0AAV7X4B3_9NEOP|nr:hypothetical protein ONE63_004576 [Megalurothrips usitatus]